MDLGCLEKRPNENKVTSVSALNKFSSQIKKPPHRKGSPINWFPRKKVDSYLKRKIKLLQEVGGMNSTLDETLGDSNPHYSKVLKEKMAVREAAHKAMETRKAAMVEASWCRILQAARIHSKDAETLLLEAEKTASEAFEAAKAIGVIMYDMPDCPHTNNQYELTETSLNNNGGRLSTHNVTASFETAFEVDKQVGAALKTAFIKLASCPSINKEEFKELLRKISENPDTGGKLQEDELSGSELESGLNCETVRNNKKKEIFENYNTTNLVELMLERLRHLQEDELSSLATIVATCGLSAALEAENDNKLQLDSSSLLSDNDISFSSLHNNSRRVSSLGMLRNTKIEPELPSLDKFLVKRMTRLEREVQEAKDARTKGFSENLKNINGIKGNILISGEFVPELGSVLVKHSSKLEKEIEEAKRTGINPYEINGEKMDKKQNKGTNSELADVVPLDQFLVGTNSELADVVPLDQFLVRHMSKLEREVQEAKNKRNLEPIDAEKMGKENIDLNKKGSEKNENIDGSVKEKSPCLESEKSVSKEIETRSLEEILIKPVRKIEREKTQASSFENEYLSQNYKNRRKNASIEERESLDKVMVKHVSRLEKEKTEMVPEEPLVKVKKNVFRYRAEEGGNKDGEKSLDQILVKHKSRLEKEKAAFVEKPNDDQVKNPMSRREVRERESQEAWGGISLGKNDGEKSLDRIFVKHKSRLEKEKVAFSEESENQDKGNVISRREVRERELQEAWGGLSLGNSIRPHISRLERDKAAWLKAEEEERKRDMEEPGEVI